MLPSLTPWNAVGSVVETVAKSVADGVDRSLSFAETFSISIGQEAAKQMGKEPSISDLRQSLTVRQAELTDAISRRLRSIGIDPVGGLELEVDAEGDFRAPVGHPLASQIELLLNTDDSLTQQAAELHSFRGEIEQLDLAARAERLAEIDSRAAAGLRLRGSKRTNSPLKLVV